MTLQVLANPGTSSTLAPKVIPARSQAVVDIASSSAALLHPLGVSEVKLTDNFWAPRLKVNGTVSLPSQYRLLWDTGRIDNFLRAAGKKECDFQGIYFNDSDVYKWLEAASWELAAHPENDGLRNMVDEACAIIEDAQDANGYLNTYFSVDRVHERWTDFNAHEMYCAGHLFQAAAANYRSTGSTRLLNVALRFADYICDNIGPAEQSKMVKLCGHEEIKMSLVELYRITDEKRYLDQASFFLDRRGSNVLKSNNPAYFQDHQPYREFTEAVGHAVRMMYLECGAVDIYLENGDESIYQAALKHWDNVVSKKMYITGGLGARHEGESFGENYELPNDRAYAETCAAIGSIMWNFRLLQASGESRFADEMERALYNGFLSGYSLDGMEYFYVNPLSDDGAHRRQKWYGCACCPPNVARQLSSLPGYFASTSSNAIWLHLYASGNISESLSDGQIVAFTVATDYPYDGRVLLTIIEAPERLVSFKLRIPGWASKSTITVNGETPVTEVPGYADITRKFEAGDTIVLDLPMEIRRVVSHPFVETNNGRVALVRGPLVYCIEQADFNGVDVRSVALPVSATISAVTDASLLGGVTVLECSAVVNDWNPGDGALYATEQVKFDQKKTVHLRAIPYYAWANREAGPMTVWIPETND